MQMLIVEKTLTGLKIYEAKSAIEVNSLRKNQSHENLLSLLSSRSDFSLDKSKFVLDIA
jgi:hypothetical protein